MAHTAALFSELLKPSGRKKLLKVTASSKLMLNVNQFSGIVKTGANQRCNNKAMHTDGSELFEL